MKLGMSGQNLSEERLQYIKQLGSDGIFLDAGVLPGYRERGYATVDELAAAKRTVATYELEILNLRTDATDTAPILQDRPDRDAAIERICTTVRAAGAVGIPTVFYNLTVWRSLGTSWGNYSGVPGPGPGDLDNGSGPGRYRRPVGRGGAVLLTHSRARAADDAANSPAEVVAPYGQISADEMWERVQYFYERVIPVAEEAGVNVGAHPDDPPERHYRGVEQILNNFEGLKRLTELVPSPRSGLLLCFGTLHEMGGDTLGAIDYFLEREKIFSCHFRNPRGTVPGGYYQEDFLDRGDIDMLELMRLLHTHNYQGSVDPDHAVGIAGDDDGRIGFAWEMGYIMALKAAAVAHN